MYRQVVDSNARLSAQSRGEQMYIDHITIQVKKIVHESRRMLEKVQALIEKYYPRGSLGQRLQDFLEEVWGQYEQIVCVDAPFCLSYLFRFNSCWTLGPFMSRFEFGPRTYSVMLCFVSYRDRKSVV